MEYKFQRHEPCFDRVLFVLTLDRKKMKERIIAGTEAAVRSRLRGNQDAEVVCDVTRPLGTFLIEFEQDTDGDWNKLGLAPLREALHTNRWKQPELEKAAGSFLSQKYQTGDPVRQYTAFRIWEGYLVARGAQRPVDAGFAPTGAERPEPQCRMRPLYRICKPFYAGIPNKHYGRF